MKGLLILCCRDWLNPQAGAVEHYVHEVFSRIARQGRYVAWVSHNHSLSRSSAKPSRTPEFTDGIQIARLGFRVFYRMMAGMVVSRLMKSGMLAEKFDAVVDCVNGRPMALNEVSGVPVVPLVFRLGRGTKVSEDPPGPLVAATEIARHQLSVAGFPEKFIVRAPYGVDCGLYVPSCTFEGASIPGTERLVAVDEAPRCLLRALARLQREGLAPRVDLVGRRPQPPRLRGTAKELVTYCPTEEGGQRGERYRGARQGYCGVGHEMEALAFGACGVPAVCPATQAGREFVEDEETGLLYAPGNAEELADCIRRLMRDDVLRKRLASNAYERAQATTWDKTAGLILATIENL